MSQAFTENLFDSAHCEKLDQSKIQMHLSTENGAIPDISNENSNALCEKGVNICHGNFDRRGITRGDSRMNAAVALIIANPSMTRLDAVLKGGFEYPTLGQPGQTDKTVVDADSVSLYQRKNQLSRRLRRMKFSASS